MKSKNNATPTKSERAHIARIKQLPCSVCDAPGPSECHEIKQGAWWVSIALCADCHRDSFNGLHGQKRMWKIMKLDEIDALAITIARLNA